MLPSLLRLIKDIIGDIESKEEYDAPLVEDFNMGDQGDKHDTDGKDDIT